MAKGHDLQPPPSTPDSGASVSPAPNGEALVPADHQVPAEPEVPAETEVRAEPAEPDRYAVTTYVPPEPEVKFADRVPRTPEERAAALVRRAHRRRRRKIVREAGAVFRFVPSARSSWNPRQSLRGYLAANFDASRAEGRATMDNGAVVKLTIAYLGGALALLIFRRSPLVRVAAGLALFGHVGPLFRRVWRTREGSPDRLIARLLATFAVVVVGDAARVTGYAVGQVMATWIDQARVRLG